LQVTVIATKRPILYVKLTKTTMDLMIILSATKDVIMSSYVNRRYDVIYETWISRRLSVKWRLM